MTSTPIPAPRQPSTPQPVGKLDDDQIIALLQALIESRVERREGAGAHIQAWDVRRTLLRIFGWSGFNVETRSTRLAAVNTDRQNRVTVIYDATVRLHIKDKRGYPVGFWDGSAAGHEVSGGQYQISVGDAYHNAISTAESTALKRAATNLGDQFGLSLYDKGSTHPVVLRSLAHLNGELPPGLEPIINPPKKDDGENKEETGTTGDDDHTPSDADESANSTTPEPVAG